MLPPLPRCSSWAYSSLISPSRVSLPRKGRRVGLHIDIFEACSAFTRVAACTLALSPIRDTLIEGFSHFVASMTAPIASGWSESPGGTCTHWKAPPCHGQTPYLILLTINILRYNIQILANMARHMASPVRELPPAVPTYALCRSASDGSGCKQFGRRSHRSSPRRYPSPAEAANCSNLCVRTTWSGSPPSALRIHMSRG